MGTDRLGSLPHLPHFTLPGHGRWTWVCLPLLSCLSVTLYHLYLLGKHVEVTEQLVGGHFLLPHGSWDFNSGARLAAHEPSFLSFIPVYIRLSKLGFPLL